MPDHRAIDELSDDERSQQRQEAYGDQNRCARFRDRTCYGCAQCWEKMSD